MELSKHLNQHQMMDAIFTVPASHCSRSWTSRWACSWNRDSANDCPPPFAPIAHACGVIPEITSRAAQGRAHCARFEPGEWTPEDSQDAGSHGVGRIRCHRTFARHPALCSAAAPLRAHPASEHALSAGQRDAHSPRGGWIGQSMRWAQRTDRARPELDTERGGHRSRKRAGMGSGRSRTPCRQRTRCTATTRSGSPAWNTLKPHFDNRQMMDVLVTFGGYRRWCRPS